MRKLGSQAEVARELALPLSYNGLVRSWPEILRLSRVEEEALVEDRQRGLFDQE